MMQALGYNAPVSRLGIMAVLLVASTLLLYSQESKQPPIRLNVLNVCTPAQGERSEIAAALDSLPERPRFGAEYEVARGRSALNSSGLSDWVRLRREFSADSPFSNAQYSFSVDSSGITETIVVRTREPKDVVQVSLEDTLSSAEPSAVLASNTPPNRVKVERLGKGVLVLARCPQANQAAYEPLFRKAALLMTTYRNALETRKTVSAELSQLLHSSDRSSSGHPKP